MGDEFYDKAASDLLFEVRVMPHALFKRIKNEDNGLMIDLEVFVHITLEEALLGFDKQLKHLDGHMVDLIRSGTT